MQIFLSIWREFKRQKANLFFTIFFPSILVFILGTMLEQWNTAEYEIPRMQIAYVAEEEYPAFEQFLTEAERRGMVSVRRGEPEEEVLSRIDKDLAAVITYDGVNRELTLHQGLDEVANRALHIMLQSYSSMEEAVILCYQNGVAVDLEQTTGNTEYVVAKKLGVDRSMIDYYAVAMLVMILFMGGSISGSVEFYDFKKQGLLNRVAITPVNKAKVFLLMIFGNIPMMALEIITIMFVSTFFFGAHYCANPAGNLMLMLCFFLTALAVNGFCALVGLLVPFNPTGLMMPISWIMLFLSGSFAKEVYIEGITEWMPIYRLQQAVFDLTLFGNYERILEVCFVATALSIVFIAAGAVVFNHVRHT